MKRIELLILAMTISINVSAQVGINTQTINMNSALEVFSINKGTLLPRIALVAANSIAPLTAHVAGMLVYNTATSGVGSNLVTPVITTTMDCNGLDLSTSYNLTIHGSMWQITFLLMQTHKTSIITEKLESSLITRPMLCMSMQTPRELIQLK